MCVRAGWDDEDKEKELTEDGTRFLLVKDAFGDLIAFVHFRFTVQGEVMDVMSGDPCVYIWDIHVEQESRRCGLGKHLMTILELIARQQKMKLLCLPVQYQDIETVAWVTGVTSSSSSDGISNSASGVGGHGLKGWVVDESLKELVGFDADLEVSFVHFLKVLFLFLLFK